MSSSVLCRASVVAGFLALASRGLAQEEWIQEAQLLASDGQANESLGTYTALSGETAVAGVPYRSLPSVPGFGTAYVYTRTGTSWGGEVQLSAPGTENSASFGCAVDVDGDTLVVGEMLKDVNGFNEAGVAHVFVRSGSDWVPEAVLTANITDPGARLGCSVSVSGDTIAVGAYEQNSPTVGLPTGAVFVFVRNGTSWTQQARLFSSGAQANEDFGSCVSLDGDTLVAGAIFTTVAGKPQVGSAYVFRRTGTTWTEEALLCPGDLEAGDSFGARIAISGDNIVAGVRNAGAAYLFHRTGSTWALERKALAPLSGGSFGMSVAIRGDRALVGAPYETVGGIPGAGAVYPYRRQGTTWVQGDRIHAKNPGWWGDLGFSADLDGDTILCGAIGVTGTGGVAQGALHLFRLGGYAENLCFGDGASGACPCGNGTLGLQQVGCRNSTGLGARLRATGSGRVSEQAGPNPAPLVLHSSQGPPNGICLFLQGAGTPPGTPFWDGLLCVGPPILRLAGSACSSTGIRLLDGTGSLSTNDPVYGFDVLSSALCGGDDIAAVVPTTRYYQLWFRDAPLPCGSGSNLTNAVKISWLP